MRSREPNEERSVATDLVFGNAGDLIKYKGTFPGQKRIEKLKCNILGEKLRHVYGRSHSSKNRCLVNRQF